jgi:hypothetical protein
MSAGISGALWVERSLLPLRAVRGRWRLAAMLPVSSYASLNAMTVSRTSDGTPTAGPAMPLRHMPSSF